MNPSLPNHSDICSLLSVSRSEHDPRTAPAVSLLLGHYVSPAQLTEMRWPDLRLASYAALVRDPKGGPARGVELSRLMVQQLIPLALGDRASRPFGKPLPGSPTITQLLASVLVRAGLGRFTPEDFVTWSKAQSEATRMSVVTA